MTTAQTLTTMQTAMNWVTHTATLAALTLETLIGVEATIPTLLTTKKCVVHVEVAALVTTATRTIAVIVAIMEMAQEPLMNQLSQLYSKQWKI